MINSAVEAGTKERNILPLSLSITTADGIAERIVERNTAIPVRKELVFSADLGKVSAAGVELTIGESKLAADNHTIAVLRVPGIKKTVGKVPKITVAVELWKDGSLGFTAFDHGSRHEDKIVLEPEDWLPSDAQISEAISAAKKNEEIERLRIINVDLIEQCRETVRFAGKVMLDREAELSVGGRIELLKERNSLRKMIKKASPASMTAEDILNFREQREKLELMITRA